MEKYYVADFICYNNIILELKAVSKLLPEHKGQVLNYLKATNKKLALLINFGADKLEFVRVIRWYYLILCFLTFSFIHNQA